MKIAGLEIFVLEFPFRSPFLIAGGVAGHPGQPSARVVVRLETVDGAVGWGEATPTPRWTYETTETIVSTLVKYLAPAVQGIEIWDFDALHRAMNRAISPGVDAFAVIKARHGTDGVELQIQRFDGHDWIIGRWQPLTGDSVELRW